MKAELIFTGSELLLGHILNIHAQYLGARLSEIGIEVLYHITVGDERDRLRQVIKQAVSRSELVIITGGLGPTTDDLTAEAVADVLGMPLVPDEATLKKLAKLYHDRGQVMPESNKKQAFFPKGSVILTNNRGTAPGALVEREGSTVIMLPGPPQELKSMFESWVLPFLKKKVSSGPVIRFKILRLTGISESAIQDKVKDLGGQGNPGIAFVAKPGEIQVRITASAKNPEEAEKMVAGLSEKVKKRLDQFIFSSDNDTLEEILGRLLIEKGLTISVAESCTGGLIGSRLTEIPGSSVYFRGGVVAYSNELKETVLGVPSRTIELFGAVSRETAVAMAVGVRKLAVTDLGIAVTGIAGPEGGTGKKPRGLVYIALASEEGTDVKECRFPGTRTAIRQGASNTAMNMVRQYLITVKQAPKI